MKLKSKTIIYELEDGIEITVKPQYKKLVIDRMGSIKPLRTVEVFQLNTIMERINLYEVIPGNKQAETTYYLDKQEARQAAEDYLKGDSNGE